MALQRATANLRQRRRRTCWITDSLAIDYRCCAMRCRRRSGSACESWSCFVAIAPDVCHLRHRGDGANFASSSPRSADAFSLLHHCIVCMALPLMRYGRPIILTRSCKRWSLFGEGRLEIGHFDRPTRQASRTRELLRDNRRTQLRTIVSAPRSCWHAAGRSIRADTDVAPYNAKSSSRGCYAALPTASSAIRA